MITEITVSNYRSFGADVHVKLGRLTALIGPNGAGKSNVTDVFKFLAESLIVGLEAAIASRHGIDVVRRWSSGRPFNLSVRMNWREKSHSGRPTAALSHLSFAPKQSQSVGASLGMWRQAYQPASESGFQPRIGP